MKYEIIKSLENGHENYVFQVGAYYYWADKSFMCDGIIETMIFESDIDGKVSNWGEVYVDRTDKPLEECIKEFADSICLTDLPEEIHIEKPDYMIIEPCKTVKQLELRYALEKQEYIDTPESVQVEFMPSFEWNRYIDEVLWNHHDNCISDRRLNHSGKWKSAKDGITPYWDIEIAFREHEEWCHQRQYDEIECEIKEFEATINSYAYRLAKQYVAFMQMDCVCGMQEALMRYNKLSAEDKFLFNQYVCDLAKSSL